MSAFRILPIEAAVADSIRATRADSHGNRDIQPTVAREPRALPCRVCLEEAAVGEEMLLFSYSPFDRPVPYQNLGPIFVHARACAPYDRPASVPDLIRRRLLALRGYDADGCMQECDVVEGSDIETAVDRFFSNPTVQAIHAHNARAGCYVCRIERAR
jgi:hypothetical protein